MIMNNNLASLLGYLFVLSLILSCNGVEKDYATWDIYRGGAQSIAYSELSQINKDNLDQLEVAWVYRSGDVSEGDNTTIQCNPIIVEGVMYITSPKLKLIALDAEDGHELWRFDPFEGGTSSGVNRGVVYAEYEDVKCVFFSAKNYLYAVNADNGELITGFGSDGKVDLRYGLGRDPNKLSVSATSPGINYKDILIMGSTTGEGYNAAPGFIRGYDIRTGEIVWTFRTIPQPGEQGYETWENNNYREIGGANVWAGFSLDKERGIVFAPTGSATYDFYGGHRKGENLYANCLIALNAETGEKIWHYQIVHHDLWDYDLPAPPSLITLNIDGEPIDVVAQVTKMGMVFIFERETGIPIFPIEEKPVPKSRIASEEVWPTQPFPTKPQPFVRQHFDENEMTDISEASNQYIKEFLKDANYGSIYTPQSIEGTVQLPGTRGGAEWGGPAVDPETGIMYVNANEIAMYIKLKEGADTNKVHSGLALYELNNCAMCHGADLSGVGSYPSLKKISAPEDEVYNLLGSGKGQMPAFTNLTDDEKNAIVNFLFGKESKSQMEESEETTGDMGSTKKFVPGGWGILLDQDGYFGVKPPWGTLSAIDLNKGEILWRTPLGIYPELVEKGLPPTGTQNLGGPLVTNGGVIFIGATRDEYFRAFDKENGEVLWEFKLPSGGYATPSTYQIKGTQYIVIAAGGGGRVGTKSGDSYISFRLK